LLVPPLTVIVSAKESAVVMVEVAGVTETVGDTGTTVALTVAEAVPVAPL
jgi:hypothetical protein